MCVIYMHIQMNGIATCCAIFIVILVTVACIKCNMNVVATGSGRLVEGQGTGEGATFSRKELDALTEIYEMVLRRYFPKDAG